MAQRSAGSGTSTIDGRDYADRVGLFSYGSGVVEVPPLQSKPVLN